MPTAKAKAFEAIDRNAEAIATVGDSIFAFAEVAMQEYETCNFVSGILKDIGFKVETGISGFPTAILATYGSGKPSSPSIQSTTRSRASPRRPASLREVR